MKQNIVISNHVFVINNNGLFDNFLRYNNQYEKNISINIFLMISNDLLMEKRNIFIYFLFKFI